MSGLQESPNYRLMNSKFLLYSLTGSALEACQAIPHIHDVMPEPFDITNHAGNMGAGAAVAFGTAVVYAARHRTRDKEFIISDESMNDFRRKGVGFVIGATVLLNSMTETRWGLDHFPVGSILQGTTPDILDTIYSTVWGGITSLAIWKKTR